MSINLLPLTHLSVASLRPDRHERNGWSACGCQRRLKSGHLSPVENWTHRVANRRLNS